MAMMQTMTLRVPVRLADLPTESLDAILGEVAELIEHHDDTDPYRYEAAADRFFAAIRAAAPEGD